MSGNPELYRVAKAATNMREYTLAGLLAAAPKAKNQEMHENDLKGMLRACG